MSIKSLKKFTRFEKFVNIVQFCLTFFATFNNILNYLMKLFVFERYSRFKRSPRTRARVYNYNVRKIFSDFFVFRLPHASLLDLYEFVQTCVRYYHLQDREDDILPYGSDVIES